MAVVAENFEESHIQIKSGHAKLNPGEKNSENSGNRSSGKGSRNASGKKRGKPQYVVRGAQCRSFVALNPKRVPLNHAHFGHSGRVSSVALKPKCVSHCENATPAGFVILLCDDICAMDPSFLEPLIGSQFWFGCSGHPSKRKRPESIHKRKPVISLVSSEHLSLL